ncbi:MAG TPA: hypothetical protein VF766_03560 [Pyrinomonadaceae bacterium]
MSVDKSDRVLLVIANLSDKGKASLRWLYEFLDQASIGLAQSMLGPQYRKISKLSKADATVDKFVKRLASLCSESETKALDVFVHLHGTQGKLHFVDKAITSSDLKALIKANCPPEKLRLLYSTACYGSTHAQDFVDAGFRTASGAMQVNANSPYDYPAQMVIWGGGGTYKKAVDEGNNPFFTIPLDALAKAHGFNDANSTKIIKGTQSLRIST